MFGKVIFGLMCFHSVTVEFITFTLVGVILSPYSFTENTWAALLRRLFIFNQWMMMTNSTSLFPPSIMHRILSYSSALGGSVSLNYGGNCVNLTALGRG